MCVCSEFWNWQIKNNTEKKSVLEGLTLRVVYHRTSLNAFVVGKGSCEHKNNIALIPFDCFSVVCYNLLCLSSCVCVVLIFIYFACSLISSTSPLIFLFRFCLYFTSLKVVIMKFSLLNMCELFCITCVLFVCGNFVVA